MLQIFFVINILFARRVNELGQLLTRDQLPVGVILTISYDKLQVVCNEKGYFLLKQEKFEVDVLGLFKQTFYPSPLQNTFIIDNNQTAIIQISGFVNQPANLTLNVNQPLNLKQREYEIKGQFTFQIDIMKLLVYSAKVLVSADSFKNNSQVIYLYGSYQYDLGIIELIPVEIDVKLKFNFNFDTECYLMCTKYNGKLYVLQNHTQEDKIEFNGKLFDEWPQQCLLYSDIGQAKLLELDGPISDLTRHHL
ncbi:unnamed protein product [Paramecium primaurelia]|uniref:Uncharacterized protein n=1 Tax=Paramecium primaurelia TaxID=5886 RepID=A0A8S1PZG0_PARPR|nr:unnamed protein product [Paramecium primaurelia]